VSTRMFGNLFAFLKPAPLAAQPLTDPEEIDRTYSYWRKRILSSIVVGYSVFYFVRKNLSFAMPAIKKELGIDNEQLGTFLTLNQLLYGVSKLTNGYVADRTNPRYLMPLGLICSAIMNVCFGLGSAVVTLGVFWMINGWFQGMGFPPCVRCLTQWFPARVRGTRFAVCNTAVSIGMAITSVLCGFLVTYNWRLCLFVPAGLAILGAAFLVNRLRDTPPSLGLPTVEEHSGENAAGVPEEAFGPGEFRRFVIHNVFLNPLVWVASFANLFLYIIRQVISDWGPTFLSDTRGAGSLHAGFMVAAFEVAGLAGILLSGWITDKVYRGRAGRACCFSMALCGVCIFFFWKLDTVPLWVSTVLLCGTGFFLYGPQCLVAVIAANLATKRAAATAVGLTGLLGYMSSIFSGKGLGRLVDKYGWDYGFGALVIASAASAALFVVLWNTSYGKPRGPKCPPNGEGCGRA
jgi:sugar phosphate permease